MSKKKSYVKGQDRNGNPARRKLEFEVVRHQVRKNPERLILRFEGRITRNGDCRLYNGSLDRNGYPRINFMHLGRKHVTILACRVFLILKLGKAIRKGHEAAHVGCRDRRCVYHIEDIHYSINANTAEKCPF